MADTLAYAEKLVRLGNAARTIKPTKPTSCPDNLPSQKLDVFDTAFLTWLGKRQPETTFGKPFDLRLGWTHASTGYLLGAQNAAAAGKRTLEQNPVASFAQLRALLGRRYVGALKTTKLVAPAIAKGGYVRGSFTGWLLVGDVETGKIVCAAAIAFGSSKAISTLREIGASEADRNKYEIELYADFNGNGRTAARAALATITTNLKLPEMLE